MTLTLAPTLQTESKPRQSADAATVLALIIMAAAENDFDQSFEYFGGEKEEGVLDGFAADKGRVDETFDSSIFEFSVAESSLLGEITETLCLDYPEQKPEITAVRVSVREQISAMYDDFSQEGAITVTGSIHVKSSTTLTPFRLVLRDKGQNVQRIEALGLCEHLHGAAGDRELLIKLQKSQSNQEFPIANYFCVPKLRPVPLVSWIDTRCSGVEFYDVVSSCPSCLFSRVP